MARFDHTLTIKSIIAWCASHPQPDLYAAAELNRADQPAPGGRGRAWNTDLVRAFKQQQADLAAFKKGGF